MAHDIPKEFWKSIHFENMTAAFLLGCRNYLRWEISLICHWNIDSWKQKLFFFICHGPQKWPKYHLDTIQTTLSENNLLLKGIICENHIFPCLKMHYFRRDLPKWVLTTQKETSCHIFKMDIFSKLFGDVMSHIIR